MERQEKDIDSETLLMSFFCILNVNPTILIAGKPRKEERV